MYISCTSLRKYSPPPLRPVNSFQPSLILKNWIGLQMQRQKILPPPPSSFSLHLCLFAPSAGWIWQMSFAICKDCRKEHPPFETFNQLAGVSDPFPFVDSTRNGGFAKYNAKVVLAISLFSPVQGIVKTFLDIFFVSSDSLFFLSTFFLRIIFFLFPRSKI